MYQLSGSTQAALDYPLMAQSCRSQSKPGGLKSVDLTRRQIVRHRPLL